MRRAFIVVPAVLLLALVPLTVLAVTRTGPAGARINCMATSTLAHPVTTMKTRFTEVADLRMSIQAVWGVSATVTFVVTGGPIRLKAIDMTEGGPLEMSPGVITVDPSSGETNAFSFTFIGQDIGRFGTQGLRVRWRVVHPGDSATIARAAAGLIYETEACPYIG